MILVSACGDRDLNKDTDGDGLRYKHGLINYKDIKTKDHLNKDTDGDGLRYKHGLINYEDTKTKCRL